MMKLSPETTAEVNRRVAVLRGLYGDLMDDLNDVGHRTDLWAQVQEQQVALAKLIPEAGAP